MNYAIVTGTGRCGTQFIAKLLAHSKGVVTRHDPNPLNLTFHRYAKWYGLPIDEGGFFNTKLEEITEDLGTGTLSVHSSAHMALSIEDLYRMFKCKVVIFYRHPADVVNSYLGKGYYTDQYHLSDGVKALGYQSVGKAPHHFFGRIVPKNGFFSDWQNLTRTGKIAWMWSTVNKEISRQIDGIPGEKVFVSKLEDFDYNRYQQLCTFLDISPVSTELFDRFRSLKVNTLSTSQANKTLNWTDNERVEFVREVKVVAESIGYYIGPDLFSEQIGLAQTSAKKKKSFFDRLLGG